MKVRKFVDKYSVAFVFIADTALFILSFLIMIWPKEATLNNVLPTFMVPFFIYLLIWVFISAISGKYNLKNFHDYSGLFVTITTISFISSFIILFLIVAIKGLNYSRGVVFGTILLSYILTSLFYYAFYKFSTSNRKKIQTEVETDSVENTVPKNESSKKTVKNEDLGSFRERVIRKETSDEVLAYIKENMNLNSSKVNVSETSTPFNIENIEGENFSGLINLKKVNEMRYINKFFEAVNYKLMDAGMFIGCVETSNQRYKRIAKQRWALTRQLVIMTDFVINRVIPKLPAFENIYFNITNGTGRTVSLAETLGRLVSCGFSIIEYKQIDNLMYFVIMKTDAPKLNDKPSYKPIFDMPRVGKNGKIIKVYKVRTMHPFSEYLQDYVLSLNGFSDVGKIKDDFRVTKWGKFLRRSHFDEAPQILNILKGEMAIFGARPLSRGVFEREYPKEIQGMRIKYKPGLIPPYAALKMQGMKESIEAEKIYLSEKDKSKMPFLVDVKYLFKAIFNIVTFKIKGA